MLPAFTNNRRVYLFNLGLFIALVVWWLAMFLNHQTEGKANDLFTVVYSVLALVGGSFGLAYSQMWGGFSSRLGGAVGWLSLGLLAQFVGQLAYNYYILVLGTE